MGYGGLKATALVVTLLAAGLGPACGREERGEPSRQPGTGSVKEKSSRSGEGVTGEEVLREVREAIEVTKSYLDTKGEEALDEMERRMKAVEKELDHVQQRMEEAKDRGKEVAGDAHEALEEKRIAVRLRMEEFRRATGEMKEEAGEKLERALQELEAAYRDFRSEGSSAGSE